MSYTTEMSVFLEAVEKESTAERDAFLDHACARDPDLRAQVKELLRVHQLPDNPLDEAPANAGAIRSVLESSHETHLRGGLPLGATPGTLIGPYKIMEQIGEGGVGLVFVAAQQRPLRRLVALKIIKPGMDTREVITRFEAERQALALMDHPNIARVLDGGVAENGRPFFVMELVRGVPITKFCDESKLNNRSRLELFVDICQAVQHAHQKGIIHRDLKPSNVLVTLHDGKPLVKVIDFGVAKAIGYRLTEETIYTRFTQMIGTPMYMSPEQAEMSTLDVDTRSDIYALGVLLYELLTSATPFDRMRMRTAAIDEVRRIVREEEPPTPSNRLTTIGDLSTISAQRRTEPARLVAQVRGDLDWIVMKAMDKQRSRRYETAAALAGDVRRFLAEEPVEARPPSTVYRFRKFARRNKLVLGTVSVVASALVLGTGVSVWQAIRASEARAEADGLRRKAEDFAERLKQANVLIAHARDDADQSHWSAAFADYTRAAELQPNHFLVWSGRGSLYVKVGLWQLAASDYARALSLGEAASGPGWRGVPQLFYFVGDDESYRRACAQLRRQINRSPDSTYIGNALRSCAIGPSSGIDVAELKRAADRMIEAGSRRPGRGLPPYDYYGAGLASLRAGDYASAIARFKRSLNPNSPWAAYFCNRPGLAIAYFKIGQQSQATAELAAADSAMNRTLADMLQAPPGISSFTFYDWLEFLCLRREAYVLITGALPSEDPRLRALEDRSLAAMK